ncbi:Bpu10I family restriction endonuclease [Litoreibacter roseus]|uniref:Uncharacterized protein n=1 Tax=Litoreibacter roseus TaxID=2601869 RepID=A0A6N6JNR2_9RHOB|nr:Bpu10I family restriction endonuclease [Litoreibacter roseus]GFE67249.1 hypothetical protein KIN_43230 [Litoreibacter roseus]
MSLSLRDEVEARKLDGASPHCNNLLHQFSAKSAAHGKSSAALAALTPKFLQLCDHVDGVDLKDDDFFKSSASLLDDYMAGIRNLGAGVFVSQSDFITSVVPEFFLRMFHVLCADYEQLFASGQRDIAIDVSFDTRMPSLLMPKMQRVDLAIGYVTTLTVGAHASTPLFIPILAAEAKTYFDKNMISGVDFSATAIKNTFPHCQYLAMSEFADFDLQALSYAASSIDEIYILRHQKRSDFRKSGLAKGTSWENVKEIVVGAHRAISICEKERSSIHDRLASGVLINES